MQAMFHSAFKDCSSMVVAMFYCDASRTFGYWVFDNCAPEFTILCAEGTKNWDLRAYSDYNVVVFNP